ncbi:hypothetical protein C8R44DRAFT_858618 [Mycena epipterygia]|nr:hypothetical protein C8R44DRAFT_858618 [Mycena epipterygia]
MSSSMSETREERKPLQRALQEYRRRGHEIQGRYARWRTGENRITLYMRRGRQRECRGWVTETQAMFRSTLECESDKERGRAPTNRTCLRRATDTLRVGPRADEGVGNTDGRCDQMRVRAMKSNPRMIPT